MKKLFIFYFILVMLFIPTSIFAKSKSEKQKDVVTVLDKQKPKETKKVNILNKENKKTKETEIADSIVYEGDNTTSILIKYEHSTGNTSASLLRAMVIDKENNVILTLKDILGEDYKNIVYKTIKEEIKKSKDDKFFDNNKDDVEKIDYLKTAVDKENYGYYIKDKDLLIAFDKGTIASNSEGIISFKIKMNKDIKK